VSKYALLSLQIDSSLMILRPPSPKVHLYSLGRGTTPTLGCIGRSNVLPLSDFTHRWRDADEHFVDPELEQTAQRFVECAGDFLSYQAIHSYLAPAHWQNDKEDTVYEYFGPNEGDDRQRFELHKGLGGRADKVLAAHNELYMIGSRFGL
jgi:hypothetical protein